MPLSCQLHWYSNVITCTDSTTEHTEDEGLGKQIWCSSASDGKPGTLLSNFDQKGIQPHALLSFELSGFKLQQKKEKTDKEENEILEYDSQAEMKKQMSHFQTTRLDVMMAAFHL